MLDVKEKQVLVFGSGISGTAAVRLLEKEGAQVILYDGNEKLDPEKVKEPGQGLSWGHSRRSFLRRWIF